MKKVLGFYRTFFQTLNPSSYEGFADSTVKNTFNYYATMTFNAFVIMLLVMLPTLVQLPRTMEPYFDKIDTFNFDIDFKTNSPIAFPEKNPILLINYANTTPSQPANIILNNNVVYGGFLLTKFTKDLSGYKDAKANRGPISSIIAFILLLMVPTLLLIFYFYILIKFFIIAMIAAIIASLIAPIMGYRIKFKNLFNTSVYGITFTLFLDLIFFAIGFSFYYIQYLPLVIYMISGIIYSGDKVDKKMKGKFLEVKG